MIAIVDSGGANIASILFALERLNLNGFLTGDPDKIINADRVILPGVGAASAAMTRLNKRGLVECFKTITQPVLGICLGMHLLYKHSQEWDTDMLGLIDGTIHEFDRKECAIVPHMGWNSVSLNKAHPLTQDIEDKSYFYFVHSYRAETDGYTIGKTDYGSPFSAIVARDNLMGCQFHPERSGSVGEQLLKNFAEM